MKKFIACLMVIGAHSIAMEQDPAKNNQVEETVVGVLATTIRALTNIDPHTPLHVTKKLLNPSAQLPAPIESALKTAGMLNDAGTLTRPDILSAALMKDNKIISGLQENTLKNSHAIYTNAAIMKVLTQALTLISKDNDNYPIGVAFLNKATDPEFEFDEDVEAELKKNLILKDDGNVFSWPDIYMALSQMNTPNN